MSDQQEEKKSASDAAPESLTQQAQSTFLDADQYSAGLQAIQDHLLGASIRQYFDALLKKHGLKSRDAVRLANLDRDFGRQILCGKRMGRRDYYLQLAFGMGLSLPETQSMLAFLGVGALYAVRERDAAMMFGLQRGYDLMAVQLLLDGRNLPPLGDPDVVYETDDPNACRRVETQTMEQLLKDAESFEAFSSEWNDHFARVSIHAYFDRLLSARGLTRRQVIDLADLSSKSNLIFQLLNGIRTARNRDLYLRLAFAMRLSLDETQSMLKFLKKGTLYVLKKRDAAVMFCLDRHYNLAEAQQMLSDHGLPAL